VIFSRNAVIDSFNGQPTLMLRAANQRQNQILERSRSPAFALSWTIMHTIDATSPLHGLNQEGLRDCTASFAVTISGLDETIMQAVHARHDYTASDILLGHRFVDLFVTNPDGEPVVDLSRIHDVTSIAA
jgi:inward rectifier potassium channel